MGDDFWAIAGALGVLVLPLLMAWWLIGGDERRSRRKPRAKIK